MLSFTRVASTETRLKRSDMIKVMTKDKPIRDDNLESASIRALSSITFEQAEIIVQGVRATGPRWVVQNTHDYNGYLSILIAPSASADKQTSFFIAGTAQCLELFEAYDDNMRSVAPFIDVEALSVMLLNLIAQQ